LGKGAGTSCLARSCLSRILFDTFRSVCLEAFIFIVTTFNTVFGTTGTPEYFYIMMAIDWLLDRFRTLVNVTGDTLVARMVEVRAGGDCGNIQNKDSDSDTPADDETSLRENSLDMQYV